VSGAELVDGVGWAGGRETTECLCFATFSSRSYKQTKVCSYIIEIKIIIYLSNDLFKMLIITCFSFNNFNLDSNGRPAPIGDMLFSPSLLPDVVSPLISYANQNINERIYTSHFYRKNVLMPLTS
jgi:hypothetical protein